MTVAELIDRVYRQPQANTFLASFVPFLSANIAEAYVYNLVFDSFVEFFERNIMHDHFMRARQNIVFSAADWRTPSGLLRADAEGASSLKGAALRQDGVPRRDHGIFCCCTIDICTAEFNFWCLTNKTI